MPSLPQVTTPAVAYAVTLPALTIPGLTPPTGLDAAAYAASGAAATGGRNAQRDLAAGNGAGGDDAAYKRAVGDRPRIRAARGAVAFVACSPTAPCLTWRSPLAVVQFARKANRRPLTANG